MGLNDFIMQVYLHAIGISEPCNVTICEGRSGTFTCTLVNVSGENNTGEIMEIQWYRFIKDARELEPVIPNGRNISFIRSIINKTAITTSLTITNATESNTGYYWVGKPGGYVADCKNISLTVTTSMYVYAICCVFRIDVFLLKCRTKFLKIMDLKGVAMD